MASSLEEHYLNMLGNPEEGDLVELEKKFKRKSAEYMVTKSSNRVDISLIQKSGELTSAYLYLKAKWEINAKDKPFVPRILRIENQKTAPLTFLEKLHLKLNHICIIGLLLLGVVSLYKVGSSFFDKSLSSAFSKQDEETLANLIIEENIIKTTSNAQVIENLKQSKEQFEQRIEQNPISPIHASARACNTTQLSSLIDSKVNINSVDNEGATPLHWTARRNCVRGSEILINAGASLTYRDKTGKTPLDWAKLSNNHESVRLLEKALKPK